jgi:putative N6-adenine-specific DNA methylase
MWNGPIECRLFRFDMIKGSLKRTAKDTPSADTPGAAGTPAP